MAEVPLLSGQEVVRVFTSFGWNVSRQRGSHIIMTKEGEIATLSVPNHKEVAKEEHCVALFVMPISPRTDLLPRYEPTRR